MEETENTVENMEIKLPGTEDREQQYYKDLLAKIREIRKSERSPVTKINDIVNLTSDKDRDESNEALATLLALPYNMSFEDSVRMANYVVLVAEECAVFEQPLTATFLASQVKRDLNSIKNKYGIYDFPSFNPEYEMDEDDNPENALLPEELKNFKGDSMVLKIEDCDRLIDTFCSRNTYYRRAFSILADLDNRVLECVEDGVFPKWFLIPYKEEGDAMFEFSHFEVDLREPDSQYRTLYVVYRYDTTIS